MNEVVTAVVNREPTSAPPVELPSNGYVLSGHYQAGQWLLAHAPQGTKVELLKDGRPVQLSAAPAPSISAVPTSTSPGLPVRAVSPGGDSQGTTSSAPMPYPKKAVAVYYMTFEVEHLPTLEHIPAGVNVVNLSFMLGDPLRFVGWTKAGKAAMIEHVKTLRARGVRMVISIGGQNAHVNLSNRQGFVNAVMELNKDIPLDGLDWDLEVGGLNQDDVIAICAELKRLRGKNFAITMAPNGSTIGTYITVGKALYDRGLLDMIGMQFYEAPVSKEAAMWRTNQIRDAGIPDGYISIGMMIGPEEKFWTIEECVEYFKYLKAAHPHLRGAYLWEGSRPYTKEWIQQIGDLL